MRLRVLGGAFNQSMAEDMGTSRWAICGRDVDKIGRQHLGVQWPVGLFGLLKPILRGVRLRHMPVLKWLGAEDKEEFQNSIQSSHPIAEEIASLLP